MSSNGTRLGVMIAIPTRGNVRMEWAVNLAGMAWPVNCAHSTKIIEGMSVTDARNTAAKAAIGENADYLFFLDDDVLAPNQTLRRFISKLEQEPEYDAVTGIVPIKSMPVEPCVFRDTNTGPYWGWTFNEFFEVDSCGMACVLIRTAALKKVGEPYFEWVHKTDQAGYFEQGEDINFCAKLKEKGGKILADGGVICGHITEKGKIYQLTGSEAPFKRADPELLRQVVPLSPEKAVK